MFTQTESGRALILTLTQNDDEDPIEPFIVQPLPMKIGRQLTAEYLQMAVRPEHPDPLLPEMTQERKEDIFTICIDGADPDGNVRTDENGDPIRPQRDRADALLSQAEGEELLIKAFMWQTIVGMDGLKAFDEGNGGTAGALKAIRLLQMRLGLLPSTTSRSTASANQTQQADTPDTTIRAAGAGSGSSLSKLPKNRRSIRQNRF